MTLGMTTGQGGAGRAIADALGGGVVDSWGEPDIYELLKIRKSDLALLRRQFQSYSSSTAMYGGSS